MFSLNAHTSKYAQIHINMNMHMTHAYMRDSRVIIKEFIITEYTLYSLQPYHKQHTLPTLFSQPIKPHTLPKPDTNTPHHKKTKKGAQWRGLTPAAKQEWVDAEAKAKEVFAAASK